MNNFKYLKRLLLALILSNAGQVSALGFSNIYVLGDSLSDQGNLFIATENLVGLGIPDATYYYSGRFSESGNYIDELSAKLGLETSPSVVGGNNFAYGGARTDYNRVEKDDIKPFPVNFLGHAGIFDEDVFPWSLEAQSQAFDERYIDDPNALYIVFSGANDLADLTAIMAFILPGQDQFAANFINKVVGGINDAIAKFVDAGARDIVVPNMPNLGVVPSVLAIGPDFAGLATLLSNQYNLALETMLTTWDGQVNIIRFDTYTLLNEVVADPAKFGFTNVTEPCYSGFVSPPEENEVVDLCANPENYLFWDKEHPTSAFHSRMAALILSRATADILDDLMQMVASLESDVENKHALAAKLDVVLSLITDDNSYNDDGAADALNAFVNSVRAQAGKKIAADDAAMLITRAELLSDLQDVD